MTNTFSPIIFALEDTRNLDKTLSLIKDIGDKISMVKLGLEFFIVHGITGMKKFSRCNIPVFLDLKLYDIPNTIAKIVEKIKTLDIEILTLHISGGRKMLDKALNIVQNTKIKLVGVTILTSINDDDLYELGVKKKVKQQVTLLAKLAKDIGLHGIVCSALEVQEVRQECGKNFIIITPGIRFDTNCLDDQKRTSSPREAINNGADYVVIGRNIIESKNPISKIELIYKSLF